MAFHQNKILNELKVLIWSLYFAIVHNAHLGALRYTPETQAKVPLFNGVIIYYLFQQWEIETKNRSFGVFAGW